MQRVENGALVMLRRKVAGEGSAVPPGTQASLPARRIRPAQAARACFRFPSPERA